MEEREILILILVSDLISCEDIVLYLKFENFWNFNFFFIKDDDLKGIDVL